jgi:hypothetical protein
VKRWTAGYLMCVSAGVVMIAAAFLPWAGQAPASTYGALQLGLVGPFAVSLAGGAALIVSGSLRTVWAALVAFLDTFAVGLMSLAIHSGLDARLPAGINASPGALGHALGFGVWALVSAALLAGAAGMVTFVEASPEVVTTVSS